MYTHSHIWLFLQYRHINTISTAAISLYVCDTLCSDQLLQAGHHLTMFSHDNSKHKGLATQAGSWSHGELSTGPVQCEWGLPPLLVSEKEESLLHVQDRYKAEAAITNSNHHPPPTSTHIHMNNLVKNPAFRADSALPGKNRSTGFYFYMHTA